MLRLTTTDENRGEDAQAVHYREAAHRPEPKMSSARPAISVVTLESRMVPKARS